MEFYKKWISSNLETNTLVIVPHKKVKEILKEADFLSGSHFGISKTTIVEKIMRQFYWTTCKKNVEN